MAEQFGAAAQRALEATDWARMDAMTDADISRQIATNPDAAPDMAPDIDVRAIRRTCAMTQAEFASAFAFSIRTVQGWECGAKRPSGPARTLLRAIKADPNALRKALAVT
jgi:putative transcriptional regulator